MALGSARLGGAGAGACACARIAPPAGGGWSSPSVIVVSSQRQRKYRKTGSHLPSLMKHVSGWVPLLGPPFEQHVLFYHHYRAGFRRLHHLLLADRCLLCNV
jgi:hypothetical protein